MTDFAILLAQQPEFNGGDAAGAAAAGGMMLMCFLVIGLLSLVIIAGAWKTFEKAGKPGWAAIVPIYNMIVLAEICDKPAWWGLLVFVPCIGIVFSVLLSIELAQKFGQGAGFGLGLAFLGFIFFPMLGFGAYQYQGSSGASY